MILIDWFILINAVNQQNARDMKKVDDMRL